MTARPGFAHVAPPLPAKAEVGQQSVGVRARRMRRLLVVLGALLAATLVFALFLTRLREGGHR